MKFYELYLCICVSFLYLSISTSQERSCFEEFQITSVEAPFVSFTEINSNISSLVVNVSESVAVNSILYYITWRDELSTPPYINVHVDDDSILDFVNIGYNVENASVYILRTMMGIVDFNNNDRQENLFLDIYFKFSNNPDLPCKIDITHDMQDENTQEPHFEYEFYTVEVREDFPLNMTIPGLQPTAYDFDADIPNNVFMVDSSSGCPIKATESSYRCQEGVPVTVFFYLTESLDYDAMDTLQYNCTVTLTDSGNPPMMSDSIISLNVIPFPDEDPVFTSEFYKGYLAESLAGSIVEVIPAIIATDTDFPPSLVSYSMNPAYNNGGEKYFAIDSSSGEVTVIQDIENDFLELNQVDFILFACDENDQCANSFLSIKFPFLSPPSLGGVEFEKDAYTTQIEIPSMGETVLQIRAHSYVNEEGIMYSFVDDGSVGLQYFDINETFGIIFATQEDIPLGSYELAAIADDGNTTDEALINIHVLFYINDDAVILTNNFVYTTVPENSFEHQVHTITGSGAVYFCILDVYPEYFSDSFNVTRNGIIYTVSFLDAENPYNESLITIKAGAYSKLTDCFFSTAKAEVLSNEVLIVVNIDDEDEFVPYFIDAAGQHVTEILYAFPEELFLQRAIGPVATIMGMDDDVSTDILNYELLPSSALDAFQMEYSSGEIYLTSEDMIPTEFYVKGHSPLYVATMTVHIEILPLNFISTMYFTNIKPSDIKNKISDVSARAKVPIYYLYSTILATSADYRTVAGHVYSTDGLQLIDWQQLNTQLDAAGVFITVKSFADQKYFLGKNDTSYNNNTNTDKFKTSTIVLGCTSGFLLILTMIVFVYTLIHKKQEHHDDTKRNASGQAYANEDFRNEESEPSFASIFGNTPLDGNVLKDSIRGRKKSSPIN